MVNGESTAYDPADDRPNQNQEWKNELNDIFNQVNLSPEKVPEIQLISIKKDIYERLIKTKVIEDEDRIEIYSNPEITLSKDQSIQFLNG